jgi:hypothetical protein
VLRSSTTKMKRSPSPSGCMTPTEEEVWQIMPTLVREEGGSVATPIERSVRSFRSAIATVSLGP